MEAIVATDIRCEGPGCQNLVQQQPGGHRRRRFCSNDCKQRAYRERVSEREEQEMRERWSIFSKETQDYLEWLAKRNDDRSELVEGIVATIKREQGAPLLSEEEARAQARLHCYTGNSRYLESTQRLFIQLFRTRSHDMIHQIAIAINQERGEQRQATENRLREVQEALVGERAKAIELERKEDAGAILALSVQEHQIKELEQILEEERSKYANLKEAYALSNKDVLKLERALQRFQRVTVLQSRQSMLQELMLLGGRLKYGSVGDLGIGEGIDAWLNYVRGVSDEELTLAIAHGFYQANSHLTDVIQTSDRKLGMEMRQRINALERDVALRDARIAELEQGGGQEAGDVLLKHQIADQAQRIAALDDQVREKIWQMGKLEEAHGSTMSTMNRLLAAAQSEQHSGAVSEQQLEYDLNTVRINAASGELLKTSYGQALQAVKSREEEIQHLKTRVEKQYQRRIRKLESRLEKQSADLTELEQARADLRQIRQDRAREQEAFHTIYERAKDQQLHLNTAAQRIKTLEMQLQEESQEQEKLPTQQ